MTTWWSAATAWPASAPSGSSDPPSAAQPCLSASPPSCAPQPSPDPPRPPSPARPDNAELFRDRGRRRVLAKDYEGAVADFDRAAVLASSEPYVFIDACIYRSVFDANSAQAVNDCDRAIALAEPTASLLASRSAGHTQGGAYAAALSDAEAAYKLDVTYVDALFLRGVAKRGLGRRTEGDADLAAARTVDPDLDRSYGALLTP